jgi:hypothetical protein
MVLMPSSKTNTKTGETIMSRNSYFFIETVPAQNKNARIVSRVARNRKLRTETKRRDFGTTQMAMSTDPTTQSSQLYIDLDDGRSVKLSGREARTLYRLLRTHYKFSRKSR